MGGGGGGGVISGYKITYPCPESYAALANLYVSNWSP